MSICMQASDRYPCPPNEFSTDLEEMPSIHTSRATELLYYDQVKIDGKIHNVKKQSKPKKE